MAADHEIRAALKKRCAAPAWAIFEEVRGHVLRGSSRPPRAREGDVKERPILFSAPMIRAILAGQKTQTRRVINPQPDVAPDLEKLVNEAWQGGWVDVACPYGLPGDRLWVRETWGLHAYLDHTYWNRDSVAGRSEDDIRGSWEVAYAADALSPYDHWRPSIYMPRWASRITLEVTSVRVERLHDITEADARAEGVEEVDGGFRTYSPERYAGRQALRADESFYTLWESINGTESLLANPWVWCVSFAALDDLVKRVRALDGAEVQHG